MKKVLGFMAVALCFADCQDKAGERTYKQEEVTNQPPSSDPNDFSNHTLDTSRGHAHDSSTVISYDTSAKAKHN
ncbi:hypothetical protein EPD60_09055 [Flaviaesturariibacter flavus]|uniref:Uncharacterized protein n=1 Tax=Flaviaesturariibacter flavus TaxID=2502780 RepID=A0A4R1BAY8_9BACT|nr:hypothetical protein [Flaviaesturariibacter flavus]TCJ14145.1 hypothetical protein EPD60_09055 [Flaviaesturariibacter flavus]